MLVQLLNLQAIVLVAAGVLVVGLDFYYSPFFDPAALRFQRTLDIGLLFVVACLQSDCCFPSACLFVHLRCDRCIHC